MWHSFGIHGHSRDKRWCALYYKILLRSSIHVMWRILDFSVFRANIFPPLDHANCQLCSFFFAIVKPKSFLSCGQRCSFTKIGAVSGAVPEQPTSFADRRILRAFSRTVSRFDRLWNCTIICGQVESFEGTRWHTSMSRGLIGSLIASPSFSRVSARFSPLTKRTILLQCFCCANIAQAGLCVAHSQLHPSLTARSLVLRNRFAL